MPFFIIWCVILFLFSYISYTFFNLETYYIFGIDLGILMLLSILIFTNSMQLDHRVSNLEFITFLLGWLIFMVGLLYLGYKHLQIDKIYICIIVGFIFIELIKITSHEIGKKK